MKCGFKICPKLHPLAPSSHTFHQDPGVQKSSPRVNSIMEEVKQSFMSEPLLIASKYAFQVYFHRSLRMSF